MSTVDWAAFGLGMGAGALVSVVFFAGLAFGIRRAMQARNTVVLLVVSAALRITMVLAVGWVVVALAGPWAFAGYGLAFLLCRAIATALARAPASASAGAVE